MIDMRFSPESLMRVAREEEGVRFSVGGWVSELDTEFGAGPDANPQVSIEVSHTKSRALERDSNVFGQFLNMSRRERGLTVQQLSESLGISPYELVSLEDGKEQPDPRIVSKVARIFGVPARRLAQLAGHLVKDQEVERAVAAFAASSSTKPLDEDAKKALYEFIKALTKM